MKRVLRNKTRMLYHLVGLKEKRVDGKNPDMRGDCSGLIGDCTSLIGDCTGLKGDCTGVEGDCTGVEGDLDQAELTDEERREGVNLSDLCVCVALGLKSY